MPKLDDYILTFFNQLEIYEDENNNTTYKTKLINSINTFLKNPTEEHASNVYKEFFETYWIGIQNPANPFLELIKKMKEFEENAGKLFQGQRDHYLHSVFVFLMGLAVFIGNRNYRESFQNTILDKAKYPDSYDTKHEEFLYRWGVASLFHDTAYPIEITMNQQKEYMSFLCDYPNSGGGDNLSILFFFKNFKKFSKFPIIEPKSEFRKEYISRYGSLGNRRLKNAISLLANNLHLTLGVRYSHLKRDIKKLLKAMESKGFIDHGFFSAFIVLKWYYHLIKSTAWHPAYFYFPVVDAASAIFLHNYYLHALIKPPLELPPLDPQKHPIAYLLIFCDVLQEWNRRDFYLRGLKNDIFDYDITISDDSFNLKYIYCHPPAPASIADALKKAEYQLLQIVNISSIFGTFNLE